MTTAAHDAAESAIRDLNRLRDALRRGQGVQVRNSEERSHARATALAWFNSHRSAVVEQLGPDAAQDVDEGYRGLLDASDRAVSRRTYSSTLAAIRNHLTQIRRDSLVPAPSTPATTDASPDFSALIADPAMRAVLDRRWSECVLCLSADADLAATVMMGGLLEGLLLAKVNSLANKSNVFTARNAPKDRRSGNPLPLGEWTLKDYIDVAHELGWISRSARDVGAVLRDYRNYVHPQKELSHGVTLSRQDAQLWWEVTKLLTRELL